MVLLHSLLELLEAGHPHHLEGGHGSSTFIFLVCMLFACMFVCTPCVNSAQGDQKGELDPVGLELQMVLNCHVGAENRTWILWKRSQCV
ncbi:hypothetical protein ACRRTK_004413 [Alexandromys fortis]